MNMQYMKVNSTQMDDDTKKLASDQSSQNKKM